MNPTTNIKELESILEDIRTQLEDKAEGYDQRAFVCALFETYGPANVRSALKRAKAVLKCELSANDAEWVNNGRFLNGEARRAFQQESLEEKAALKEELLELKDLGRVAAGVFNQINLKRDIEVESELAGWEEGCKIGYQYSEGVIVHKDGRLVLIDWGDGIPPMQYFKPWLHPCLKTMGK